MGGDEAAFEKIHDSRDEELVALYIGGSEAAFEKLVRKYEVSLVSFLYRYLGNVQEAEEVFQETFIRVYTNAQRFDQSKKFKTWLYTIALNLARTLLKRRRNVPFLAREDSSGGNWDKIVLEGQASDSYSPERKHEAMEIGELVKKAVRSLPERQQEVFILFQYQGLNYAEISSVLERPLGTIKSQMHYAVLALREKLGEAYPQT